MKQDRLADVCLILEGTYPYVSGGVSAWVHALMQAQSHLTFSIVALLADKQDRKMVYELPANVLGVENIYLQHQVSGVPSGRKAAALVADIERPLTSLLARGGRDDLQGVLRALSNYKGRDPMPVLMNSEAAWDMLLRIYEATMPAVNFLDHFWSWRSLVGGLMTVLTTPLPPARIYHAVSTGYAGVAMARAALEQEAPSILTEHGIYTNERRIEIAMADWLHDISLNSLDLSHRSASLRDFWIDAFMGYSRATYESASTITTLYRGNQESQVRDGAPIERMRIIPNGIDYDGYSALPRDNSERRPTVALIGRVVPIKDVKTFIRSIDMLRRSVPDVLALIMGPTEEDPDYAMECRELSRQLGLEGTLEFTGRVRIPDYLPRIDLIALTSISEAQPLVILEAGAAGIPTVATDVGACREIIFGRDDESPVLGAGGAVTPLSNPLATARAMASLLDDPQRRAQAGRIIQKRVELYYNKHAIDALYRNLYEEHFEMIQSSNKAAPIKAAI
jgi:glycosyltransferase involved in cell wall biosynthesis